ncbi:hypothetical protein LDENG_00208480 [Lucifuga dentata]|nr:hypothetical protein LDENG_00208480 [Lucifuga dentata]
MKREEDKCLMDANFRVKLEGGGVRRDVRGVLRRSAGPRRCGLRQVRGHLLEPCQSVGMFVFGLLLATMYGVTALFLQQQPLWPCVRSTLGLAFLAAFGMGMSTSIRANVILMLPSLCSAKGRNFLLLLSFSLLMSGPVTNMLDNTERAAASVMCGAELAANQTRELLQKITTPLYPVLDKIREISSNARGVVGRVKNFIDALTGGIRHIARTLRNVLHFLVDVGDICNAKMGSPYRKCLQVFTDARSNCDKMLGEFNFLCDIVDGFRPLCNIAQAGKFFCIIPSYIASQIHKRLAAPIVAAFERMRREFDFNISASVTFDLDVNSSQSVQGMTQRILAELSSQVELLQALTAPLRYLGLLLLTWTFLQAVLYKRRYLRNDNFDNIYITAQFEELDQQLARGGGASVLPITRREAKTYISPLCVSMTSRERRAVLRGLFSVLRHAVMGGVLVALDFLVFWVLDQVHHQVKADIFARAPVAVAVQVNGSGYASDIYKDMVTAFNILQGGNVTVISKKCVMEPSEPNYTTCFILGFLYGLSLLVSLIGGFMQRCRRPISAAFYPNRELERICFLRKKILDERRIEGRALRRSAARSRADGGGGGGGWSRLRSALLRRKDNNTVTCVIPRCTALYCRPCFHSLGNICMVCMRPLTFQEDSEEELDSSDEEDVRLWQEALNSLLITDPNARTLLRRRISTATRRRLSSHTHTSATSNHGGPETKNYGTPMRQDEEGGEGESGHGDSDSSEADMTYQDQPAETDDSDSDVSFQDEPLPMVVIHDSQAPQNSPGSLGPPSTAQNSPNPFQDPRGPSRMV